LDEAEMLKKTVKAVADPFNPVMDFVHSKRFSLPRLKNGSSFRIGRASFDIALGRGFSRLPVENSRQARQDFGIRSSLGKPRMFANRLERA